MPERITGHTEMIGLIADPIRHSSSPTMHNEAFAKLGLDYVYLAFEIGIGELEDTIRGFRAMKLRGFNVSMPNKTIVHRYLDRLSPAAQLCGTVNTVVNDNGILTGHITDGAGYMDSLRDEGIDMTGKKMTIVGCGGVGTAIEIQAALDGVGEISIFNNRDAAWERGEKTVCQIRENTNCKINLYDLEDLDRLKAEIADSVLFANATNVGMKPLESKSVIPDASFFRPDLIVTDVIYSPRETLMLKMAREAGCRTMNGIGLMLFQGARAFKLWTGKDMPVEYLKGILYPDLTV